MGIKHVLSWAFALAVTATVALAVPFGGGGGGFTPDQINGPISAFGVPLFAEITPIIDGADTLAVLANPSVTQNSTNISIDGRELQ